MQTYTQNDEKQNQKNMEECDKGKSHIRSKLHAMCISSSNVIRPITKTFNTLHCTSPSYTSLHLSALHFYLFELHPTTLQSTLI